MASNFLSYTAPRFVRRSQKAVALLQRPSLWPAIRQGCIPAIEAEHLFAGRRFDTILDVGANVGQFAAVARAHNPEAMIYSFEPIRACYERLRRVAEACDLEAFNLGLGSSEGKAEIHVCGYSGASSLYPFTARGHALYPDLDMIGTETIQLTTLDQWAPGHLFGVTLLKIDVQGYELEVLKGAVQTLPLIDAVYAEVNFAEVYEGQPLAEEIVSFMAAQGFSAPVSMNGFGGVGGQAVQADYLFTRA